MKRNGDRIAIYSRKSRFTGKGESIGNQIELCKDYVRNVFGENYGNCCVVFEDEGFSGSNLKRPDFQKMMESVRKHKFKAIVVYRLDRISRNISDFTSLMYAVKEYIQNYVVKRRIQWDKRNIQFYLAARQNKLIEARQESAQSTEKLIELYEAQLKQEQEKSDEYAALADSYAYDYETCKTENEQLRRLLGHLKNRVTYLQETLEAISGDADDQKVPLNGTYSDVSEWVEKYYPGRIMLTSRAIHSLKDACYSDTELVYKCLKLLATSYYDYKTGHKTYQDFIQECKAVDSGLEERGAITDVAAGMEGDTYFVQYRGKRRMLERHLAKGSNKDRRYCLRIYFFWDAEDQMVVIGDLPHHLDTAAT